MEKAIEHNEENVGMYNQKITQLFSSYGIMVQEGLVKEINLNEKFSNTYMSFSTPKSWCKNWILNSPIWLQKIEWYYSLIEYKNQFISVSLFKNSKDIVSQLGLCIHTKENIAKKYVTFNNFSHLLRYHTYLSNKSYNIQISQKRDISFIRLWLMMALDLIISHTDYGIIAVWGVDKKRNSAYKYLERYGFKYEKIGYLDIEMYCFSLSKKEKKDINSSRV